MSEDERRKRRLKMSTNENDTEGETLSRIRERTEVFDDIKFFLVSIPTLNDGDERFLKLAQVQELIPWCKAQIYREIKKGNFPSFFKAGKSSFWRESEVREHMKKMYSQGGKK
jgi:predicted DNA-binding transcriptional regulator AlpA